jgi:ubiquinone/menaquinone biosynthesis C-methylase UbiE
VATNRALRRAYTLWASFYDAVVYFLHWSRRRSFALLNVQAEDIVLVVGCGTGSDFEFLPAATRTVAVDLTPAMLKKARRRIGGRRIHLAEMDAMRLGLPGGAFDKTVLHLILAVVPDAVATLREAERVTRPGGRLVVLDKFWNRPAPPPLPLRALNALMGGYVSHISRNFTAILAATSLRIVREIPLAVGDLYMLYLLEKPAPCAPGTHES